MAKRAGHLHRYFARREGYTAFPVGETVNLGFISEGEAWDERLSSGPRL